MYHASAFSISAEFDRPRKHSLAPQASTLLATHGGHNTQRVSGYKADGLISFKEAYSEVAGSYDECNGMHTTYALSVLEGVNVADMLTADRVVSRMAVYYSADDKNEASYDIVGSYYENLRIAGHKVDIKLATNVFHDHDTYSKVTRAHQKNTTDDWLVGSKLSGLKNEELADLENTYNALSGISGAVKECKNKKNRPADRGGYWFSPANHLDWAAQPEGPSEIQAFGSIICIPKFGVIRLAEMTVQQHSRTLRMFRVQMCSTGHGNTDGPNSGGGTPPPPPSSSGK
jgi:hypothetical protein